MAEVSLNKVLAGLDEVAVLLGGAYVQGAQEVRGAIKKLGINDRVEVSQSSDNEYGVVVKYNKLVGSIPHTGELRFSSTQIREGLFSKPIFESSATSDVFALFVFGLDPRPTINRASWNPLIKSASDLYRCLMQNESETACANERVALQEKVIDRTFAEAKAIWGKIDNFLEEARRRDDNDSDLDELDRIVLRWGHFRPVVRPQTAEGIKALFDGSQRMRQIFESSDSFKSLIFDEGDGFAEVDKLGGGYCGGNSYNMFFSLGGYVVYKEHERVNLCPQDDSPGDVYDYTSEH